jgi:hypothetical protein
VGVALPGRVVGNDGGAADHDLRPGPGHGLSSGA